MLAIDGVGFDWSDMAEEQVQTNMALMAFSDSEVYNDKTCTKTCLKNYETLKKQCDDLIVNLNQTEFIAATYKRGLATVEEQLITYRKNEFEKVKQEKESIEFKIEKSDNASKSLDKLLGSQITDKNPEFKSYGYEDSKQESNIVCDKKSDDSKENSDDSLAHCKYHQRERMVYGNNYNRVNYNYTTNRTHLNAQRNMVPRAVLMKTGLKPFNTARTVNTAHLKSTANDVKALTCWVWRPTKLDSASITLKKHNYIDAQGRSNGCSRHMTGNIAYLSDFMEFDGGYVTFGGGAHGGRISSKRTLKTDSLDFEDVYFVNELNFNLFSVSQMCDKKNYVLFTDTECLVLSPNFKLPDESQILLKIPRKDNMYSFDMKNIVPKESLTCLVAKATSDESMLWHRRLGHINFKNINKLVKDNLVRGLPTKHFENDQTCVACLKGKQHRASCKSKVLNPITKPLFLLHMDLFGPTFLSSLMHKKYCLVVTDDYSRFT
ncbi:putative ribonuclease H-like domain-containing protein [Tanacetum coccineum]